MLGRGLPHGAMVTQPECLFCRIVAGDEPAEYLVERDDIVVFKDKFPRAPVHYLVVPTSHLDSAHDLDADHRAHAVVELAIRDLKHGTGLNHCPSGSFNANAAWLLATTLAHNLTRWTQVLGAPQATSLINAKTFRRRLLTIPGRLTRSARRWTLHLPSRWPWQHVFEDTLGRLRALPAPM